MCYSSAITPHLIPSPQVLVAYEQCRKIAQMPFPFPTTQFLLVILVIYALSTVRHGRDCGRGAKGQNSWQRETGGRSRWVQGGCGVAQEGFVWLFRLQWSHWCYPNDHAVLVPAAHIDGWVGAVEVAVGRVDLHRRRHLLER